MQEAGMSPRGRAAPARAALLLLALAACEEARGVNVQPLPPLEHPSPEARAGLPVVSGTWRFTGWELPVRDTATAGAGMLPPGDLVVRTQRLDSVAGSYVREGQRFPFVGEVRRDGVFSVVAFGSDGVGSFVAGRVVRDTLWIDLTSLSVAQTWSPGARAAMVRTPVRQPFVRYEGGYLRPNPDSLRIVDSLRVVDSLRLADSARAGAPAAPAVGPGLSPQPAPEQVRPAAPAPQRQAPAPPPATVTPPPTPPRPRPQPPAEQPPRRRPPAPTQETDPAPRREQERRREREREALPPPPVLPEPVPEETPARPDTTRRPEPVIIP